MLKKFIAVLVSIACIMPMTVSYADQPSPKLYTLSLDKAIEMAVTDSPELAVCDINKQNLKKQLKEAAQSKKDFKNVEVNVSQNFEMIYIRNGYYVNMYRAYVDLADKEKEKTRASIAYDTTQKYFTYKNALRLCDVASKAVDRANSNLKLVEQMQSLGMCTGLEVENAKIALSEAQANLQKMNSNALLAKESLKIRLSIDGDAQFNLTDSVSTTEFSADLDADIPSALSKRYDVKALQVNSDLADEYFNGTKIFDEDSTTYFSAYTKYIESTHNYNVGVKNISLLIKSSYYDVVNAQNATDIAKKKLDYKTNEYEVYKLKYEMGMITNDVLTAISDDLTMAEISYENALLTEKLAIEKYKYEITIGL